MWVEHVDQLLVTARVDWARDRCPALRAPSMEMARWRPRRGWSTHGDQWPRKDSIYPMATTAASTDHDRLAPHLLPSERVIWSGRPNLSRWFSPIDLWLVPFSLLWGGFAIFWEVMVLLLARGGVILFALWGVPFVLIGQYMIWGRFLVRRFRRRHTTYALTDRRVLVLSHRWRSGEQLQASFLSHVPAINLRQRSDGSGTIQFGSASGMFGMSMWTSLADAGWPAPGSMASDLPVFFDIANVAAVYRVATEQRNAASVANA